MEAKGLRVPPFVIERVGNRLAIILAVASMPPLEWYQGWHSEKHIGRNKAWIAEKARQLWWMEVGDRANRMLTAIKDLTEHM